MITDKDYTPMFCPHVISSFESEVAIPKVQEISSQEIEFLHSLRINPKLSSHIYMLNADYNQSSE
jgi:hypothetical protein